jgi:hypothetical protein
MWVAVGLDRIPPEVDRAVVHLDLSHNCIKDLRGLGTAIETLVLDHNQMLAIQSLPDLPRLHTLFVNNNSLHDLNDTLNTIKLRCPNIKVLAMMRNPLCPDPYFADSSNNNYALLAYQKYRIQVISALPNLKFLDATPVTSEERKASRKMLADQASIPSDEGQNFIPQARAKKQGTLLNKTKARYDGNNSEGNRFIKNKDL